MSVTILDHSGLIPVFTRQTCASADKRPCLLSVWTGLQRKGMGGGQRMIKVSSYTITSPALPPLPLFILISMSLSLTESTSDCYHCRTAEGQLTRTCDEKECEPLWNEFTQVGVEMNRFFLCNIPSCRSNPFACGCCINSDTFIRHTLTSSCCRTTNTISMRVVFLCSAFVGPR